MNIGGRISAYIYPMKFHHQVGISVIGTYLLRTAKPYTALAGYADWLNMEYNLYVRTPKNHHFDDYGNCVKFINAGVAIRISSSTMTKNYRL